MPDFEIQPTHRHGFAVPQHQIGLRRRLHLEAKHLCLEGRVTVELNLVRMQANWKLASKQLRQLEGAAYMIEVTVGVENHRRAEARLAHPVGDLFGLFTWIDDYQL